VNGPKNFQGNTFLENVKIIHPIIQSHIPKDMNPKTDFFKNSKVANTEKNTHPCFNLMNNVFVT
jgi:hypothetical protein